MKNALQAGLCRHLLCIPEMLLASFVLLQFWGNLDWFNFFASAPGLSVFTTADPGTPKPTHVPFEVLWNCYPRGYISTSAKENSVDKFFSLWVLQEHGCSKCSQRTEQLIALNGNQLIVSLYWFPPLLSLPGHSDYHTSSTPVSGYLKLRYKWK